MKSLAIEVIWQTRATKRIYTYNALNQLVSTNDTKGIERHFNYDKRGNLTQITENNKIKNSYEFGAINRLTKATNSIGQIANYDYNGFGFRVGKQVNDNLNPTKHISYVLDLTKQYHNLLQMSDDTHTQSYTWDNNVAFTDGNAYLQDELGSPLRYIDNAGSTIDSYGYTEFGDDIYGNQGATQPFGYTGYTADNVTGTYFAQAREYLPGIGRFISEDLFQDNDNWYSYCDSNPIAFIDPSGNVACPLDGDEFESESGWDLFWRGVANGFIEPWSNLYDGVTGFLNNPWGTIETAATDYVNNIISDPWGFVFGTFSDAFNFTMNNISTIDMISPVPSGREMGYIYINIFGNLLAGNPYGAGRIYGNMVGEVSISASIMAVSWGVGKAVKGVTGAVRSVKTPRPTGNVTFNGNPVPQQQLVGLNTVTSNLGKKIDFRPAAKHSTTQSSSLKGAANSSVDIINKKSSNVLTRRWFGEHGKQVRDVDLTNHGFPKTHPEWPHEHGPR